MHLDKAKKQMLILMTLLVLLWGLEYIFAKRALEELDPLCLLFYKYIIAAALMLAIRLKREKGPLFQKRDIGLLVACAIFGDILYFYAEYAAMAYMPISLITIVLGFVPVVSVGIDLILYKRKAGKKVVAGIFVCIFGIALIIGVDFDLLFDGRIIGYLLAFSCIFSWNAYNFITASLHERYTTVSLSLNQLLFASAFLLPFAAANSPPLAAFSPDLIVQILYLGALSGTAGFLIMVRSLHILGPTTTAVFSNFLPVSATFCGWLFLGETIAPLQLAGGVIVIAAGYIVIKERGKMTDG